MRHLMIFGAILLCSPAEASSPAAWKQLRKQAERGCIAAAGFRRPRVSSPILFDDSVGSVALLVTGIYPQARLKGAHGTVLCLFNRRTKKVAVEEAKGWREAQ